jgi:ATP adenylyltransferase
VGYEQLWAPWRLAYVQGDLPETPPERLDLLPGADPECFLCQAAASTSDRRRLVVWRSEHSLVLLNRYPYNNGHLLVSPRHHRASLDQLTPEEQLDLAQCLTRMVGLLERTLHPDGFNVGLNLGRAAGAGLPGHLHWHVVPRWSGDTNFMPALSAVKVIPQALDALWEVLRGDLSREEASKPVQP